MQRAALPECVKLQQRVIRGVEIEIRQAKKDLDGELRLETCRQQNLQKRESKYIAKLESAYRDVADLIAQGKKLTCKQLYQVRRALFRRERYEQSELYNLVKQLMGYGDDSSNVSQRREIRPNDPVAEAAKIARTASVGGIDWTREPTNERERLVREKVLYRRYGRTLGSFLLYADMLKLGLTSRNQYPSDVRKFFVELREWEDTERQKKFSAEMQQEVDRASQEVDGLQVEDDDDEELSA